MKKSVGYVRMDVYFGRQPVERNIFIDDNGDPYVKFENRMILVKDLKKVFGRWSNFSVWYYQDYTGVKHYAY